MTHDDLLRLAREAPGLAVTELRQRAGLGWGAFYHQLRRLEADGLVRTVRVGARRIVVPAGPGEPDEVLRARVVLKGGTLLVAEAIARGDARSTRALAEALGMPPRGVRRHVARLMTHGLVTSVSPRRHEGLKATPLLLRTLPRVPTRPEPRAPDAPAQPGF